MHVWFYISLFGFISIMLPYFLSLEHQKLEEKYGKQQGKKIGDVFGVISGWGFFLFWFGIWLSPQERFLIPYFQNFSIQIPLLSLAIFLLNFMIFIPFFIGGAWFGVKGVNDSSLRVAETHRAERVISSGVYSIIRHPQYRRIISAFRLLFSFIWPVFSVSNALGDSGYLHHLTKGRDRTDKRIWSGICGLQR